jgi:hypothetical protein
MMEKGEKGNMEGLNNALCSLCYALRAERYAFFENESTQDSCQGMLSRIKI